MSGESSGYSGNPSVAECKTEILSYDTGYPILAKTTEESSDTPGNSGQTDTLPEVSSDPENHPLTEPMPCNPGSPMTIKMEFEESSETLVGMDVPFSHPGVSNSENRREDSAI